MIMIAAAYLEPLTPSHRPLMAMWRKPAVVRSSHGQEAANSAAPTEWCHSQHVHCEGAQTQRPKSGSCTK